MKRNIKGKRRNGRGGVGNLMVMEGNAGEWKEMKRARKEMAG